MTLSCSWHRLDAGTTGGAASRIRFMSHDMALQLGRELLVPTISQEKQES